jgi:DNA-directed RNA polymerase specialized sigma24 family protein
MLNTRPCAEDRYRLLAPILEARLAAAFTDLPRASVEDAAQHAWEQLLRKPPEHFAGRDPLPWLLVVARNALRVERRRRQTELLGEPVAPALDLDQALDVRAAFAALSRHQQTALTCRGLGLRYREASRATGRTYTWVNRHISEGRKALRLVLGSAPASQGQVASESGERAR